MKYSIGLDIIIILYTQCFYGKYITLILPLYPFSTFETCHFQVRNVHQLEFRNVKFRTPNRFMVKQYEYVISYHTGYIMRACFKTERNLLFGE